MAWGRHGADLGAEGEEGTGPVVHRLGRHVGPCRPCQTRPGDGGRWRRGWQESLLATEGRSLLDLFGELTSWAGRKEVEGKVRSGCPRGRWTPAERLWGTSPGGTPGEEGCFTIPDEEDEDTQRGVLLEGTRVSVANQPLIYKQGELWELSILL